MQWSCLFHHHEPSPSPSAVHLMERETEIKQQNESSSSSSSSSVFNTGLMKCTRWPLSMCCDVRLNKHLTIPHTNDFLPWQQEKLSADVVIQFYSWPHHHWYKFFSFKVSYLVIFDQTVVSRVGIGYIKAKCLHQHLLCVFLHSYFLIQTYIWLDDQVWFYVCVTEITCCHSDFVVCSKRHQLQQQSDPLQQNLEATCHMSFQF